MFTLISCAVLGAVLAQPKMEDWSTVYWKAVEEKKVLVVGGGCLVPTGAWVSYTKESDAFFKNDTITICLHREGQFYVAARLPCNSTTQQISQAVLDARMPPPVRYVTTMPMNCGPMGCSTCGSGPRFSGLRFRR
jgi:hypothetical protein